jgi:hypothetical protein
LYFEPTFRDRTGNADIGRELFIGEATVTGGATATVAMRLGLLPSESN